jgi:hypothetical protein
LKIKTYKTIILPVVLYCYDTWSLKLLEQQLLKVIENMILRKVFVLKRDENGEWRRMNNREIHILYLSG